MTDQPATQIVTLFVTEGERVARFEQTREIHWPGRQNEDITTLIREVADYAIERIETAKAVPIEEPTEENPTGGTEDE